MIKQKQLFKHNPEKGIYGDCQRTVLACFFDMKPEEIPNFGVHVDSPQFEIELKKWLKEKGYAMMAIAFTGTLDEVLATQKYSNPDMYYFLAGRSKNGTNHVVIGLNDEIYWDTAIDNSGIVGPCTDGYYWIEYIVAINHLKD